VGRSRVDPGVIPPSFPESVYSPVLLLTLTVEYLLAMLGWTAALLIGFVKLLDFRRSRRKARRPTWPANLGLGLCLSLGLVTSIEWYYALFVDRCDSFNKTNLSKRWFELHFDRQRNNETFRDSRDLHPRIPRGLRRIIFLGDSFTAGHGVPNLEDRFSNQFEADLEKRFPGRFVVANMGECGYDITLVDGLIDVLIGKRYDVDTVVYAYVLNDIEWFDPRTSELIKSVQSREPRFFLFSQTYFLNWAYCRSQVFAGSSGGDYFPHLRDAYDGPAWDKVANRLIAMRDKCRNAGIDFRLMLFPFIQSIGPDYSFQPVHEKIAAFCQREGIPFCDVTSLYRRHLKEGLVVSRFDAHPNERAHRLAADVLRDELFADLFHPESSPRERPANSDGTKSVATP
jgi:lysophospholipase L1-like esterase